jgi:hypothetical protein
VIRYQNNNLLAQKSDILQFLTQFALGRWLSPFELVTLHVFL